MADQYNSAHTGAEIDQAVSDVQNNKAAWSSKPQPSDTKPKAPGTASAGLESAYARGDHVHPSDATKQSKINVDGIVKCIGAGVVTRAIPGTDYAQVGDIQLYINRPNMVDMSNTNYGYYMARGEALFSSETTPNANGCIAWVYG